MIDSWPPLWRHLLFAVTPVVLGWVSYELVPKLNESNPGIALLIGAIATALLAYLTPLTRQYGIGARKASQAANGADPA